MNRKPKMTKVHFAWLANLISEGFFPTGVRKDIAKLFADRLPETNPAFQRYKFLRACGVDERE